MKTAILIASLMCLSISSVLPRRIGDIELGMSMKELEKHHGIEVLGGRGCNYVNVLDYTGKDFPLAKGFHINIAFNGSKQTSKVVEIDIPIDVDKYDEVRQGFIKMFGPPTKFGGVDMDGWENDNTILYADALPHQPFLYKSKTIILTDKNLPDSRCDSNSDY